MYVFRLAKKYTRLIQSSDTGTGAGGTWVGSWWKVGCCSLPTRQLVVDPVSKALLTNGSSTVGVLQFNKPFTDRVLQTLLLSERNQVTRTEDEVLPT